MNPDSAPGARVRFLQPDLEDLYGCTMGDDPRIGEFVETQEDAVIGARCKISSGEAQA